MLQVSMWLRSKEPFHCGLYGAVFFSEKFSGQNTIFFYWKLVVNHVKFVIVFANSMFTIPSISNILCQLLRKILVHVSRFVTNI